MCRIIVVLILLCKYCYMHCDVPFSHIKNCALKIISNALLLFKSNGKYERKMLNRLRRNFKRKIYVNSFCLMSQVFFFFGGSRWTDGKRMKQNKSCLKLWRYRILPVYNDIRHETLFYRNVNQNKEDENIWLILLVAHTGTCKWYLLFVNNSFVKK